MPPIQNTGRLKLVVPTDFKILEAMSDGKRQTAPNLAEIVDENRKYMNDRLSKLAGSGLVQRVGPSKKSMMYEITPKGRAALELEDEYEHDTAHEFDDLVAKRLAGMNSKPS